MKKFVLTLLFLLVPALSWAPPIGGGSAIYGPSGATTMSELTDTATATTDQIMGFNGTSWAPTDQAGAAGGDPDQNLWDDVIPDTGVTVTADGTTGDLTIAGGAGVSTAGSNAAQSVTITVDHDAIANYVGTEHIAENLISHDTIADVSTSDHHTATVAGDLDHGGFNGLADDDHASYYTTGEVQSGYQPLDATLTDLAAAPLTEAESIGDAALPTAITSSSYVGTDVTAVTTLDIPSGATCDSSEAGELCVDTTDDQLIYYGAAARVIPYKMENSFAIASTTLLENPDTHRLIKSQDGITITDIHCITDTGTVIIELMEQSATGTGDATVDAPITCDSNGAEDDGSLTNGPIDAADWIAARIGTAASSPTILNVTWYYTVTRE